MAEALQTCGSCGHATEPKTSPRAPTGLGTAGRALWRDVHGAYDLDPQDARVLREACRTLDEIRRVETVLDAAPSLVTRGSQGQDVGHPLLGELRSHRATYDKLMRTLALPDALGNTAPTTYQQRSQAANDARWAPRRAEKARQAEADVIELNRGSA